MTVKAKMYVSEITATAHNSGKVADGKNVTLQVVTDDSEENKSFSKWTPSGTIKLYITNPDALDVFELGKEFYRDFTPANV